MTAAEIHQFGIESSLPRVRKEGIEVEVVNVDYGRNPQIIGMLEGRSALVLVRTAMYPDKGKIDALTTERSREWAAQRQALPLFASVGLARMKYPDPSNVTDQEAIGNPSGTADSPSPTRSWFPWRHDGRDGDHGPTHSRLGAASDFAMKRSSKRIAFGFTCLLQTNPNDQARGAI